MHFRNYFSKLKMPTYYYSEIIIIYVNNSNNIHSVRLVKFLLSLSASASAFAPFTPISFCSKIIMTKWKNNRLIIAIINKQKTFVWTLKDLSK